MAATLEIIEYLANATSTATATNLNFGSTISANLNPTSYPITAGTYSYEKWLKLYFGGSFTNVSNIKFWKSSGTYVIGEAINWTGVQTTYVAPTNVVSSIASTSLSTTTPSSANVSIGNSLSGSLTTTGYSDYIVLQASITTLASAGQTNQKEFSISWDES